MTTRNGIVTRELRGLYQDRIPSSELKVFCVSNTMYWEYRDKPENVSKPYLDLSGILELRKHAISIVAQNQHRSASRYMKDDIPAFIGSVKLWVQSGATIASVERKMIIYNTVQQAEVMLAQVCGPAPRSRERSYAKTGPQQSLASPVSRPQLVGGILCDIFEALVYDSTSLS